MVEAVVYSLCKVTLLRFIIGTLYFFRERTSKKKKKKNSPTLDQVSRLNQLMMDQSYFEVITNASETFGAREPHPRVRMAQLVRARAAFSARVFEFNPLGRHHILNCFYSPLFCVVL